MSVQTYYGACQCGTVRLTAEPDLDEAGTCNCSRGPRLGLVLAFTPANCFTLAAGEDVSTDYLCNRHAVSHRFCRSRGVQAYSMRAMPAGTSKAAVDLNCLDGVDTRALLTTFCEGGIV